MKHPNGIHTSMKVLTSRVVRRYLLVSEPLTSKLMLTVQG